MNYTNLGTSGLRVSRVCLGMMGFGNDSDRPWVIDEDAAEPIVRAAVEGGVTFFDTADAYSGGASEVATGRLVPKFLSRDEVVIATKVFMPVSPGENGGGLGRKHILSGIDASLKRLKMDYVDLYQIHRWDPRTPIEETMEALHDVVRSGKARYIGASSMFSWQFAKAQYTAEAHGWTKFVSMQNHYNLVYREEEREMIPLCLDQGVGCIPWSPLARGMLAGNRTRDGGRHTTRSSTDAFTDYLYDQPTDFDVVDAVVEVAAARDVAPAQVALAWLLAKPGVARADRRRDQEEAPEGGPGRRGAPVVRRRDRSAGEALRAASRPRPLLRIRRGSSARVASPAQASSRDRGWHAGRTHGGRLPRTGPRWSTGTGPQWSTSRRCRAPSGPSPTASSRRGPGAWPSRSTTSGSSTGSGSPSSARTPHGS